MDWNNQEKKFLIYLKEQFTNQAGPKSFKSIYDYKQQDSWLKS